MLTVDDLRIRSLTELTPPDAILEAFPRNAAATDTVSGGRTAVHDILEGRDDRLIVVVGPCSIHDPVAALDYAERLAAERARLGDARNHHAGLFREAAHHGGLEGADQRSRSRRQLPDRQGPARSRRKVLLDINDLGLPAACEFLDMTTPQYIADLVAWGAIGARTTESQIHRELASGLSCPVGFKNGTDGNVRIAVDAVKAAVTAAPFPGRDQGGPRRHRLDHRQRGLPHHPARRQGAEL